MGKRQEYPYKMPPDDFGENYDLFRRSLENIPHRSFVNDAVSTYYGRTEDVGECVRRYSVELFTRITGMDWVMLDPRQLEKVMDTGEGLFPGCA